MVVSDQTSDDEYEHADGGERPAKGAFHEERIPVAAKKRTLFFVFLSG